MARRSLLRSLLLLGGGLLAGGLVVEVLVHDGPLGSIYGAYLFPVDAALYVAAGLVAWWRRPANRLGSLMVLAGAAVLAGSLGNTEHPALIAVGAVTATLPLSVVIHLVHAWPSGEVRGRVSGATVGAAYIVGLVFQAPIWAFRPEPPPFDVLLVSPRADLAHIGGEVQKYLGLAVVAVTVALLGRRLRALGRSDRRVVAPLLGYALFTVVAVPVAGDVLAPLGVGVEATADAQLAAIAVVPLGFLLLVLRGGFVRPSGLGVFVDSVASWRTASDELDTAVAAALGDPAARLLRWSAGTYVDGGGRPVDLPEAPHLTTLTITGPDRLLGAVVVDTSLGADPAELAAVTSVVGIALEREQLAQEVANGAAALREASLRLLAAGDDERRRIARDLHDGLQGSLVLLGMQARQLAQAGSPETASAVLADGLDAAARSLRDLVDGVLPSRLVDGGLAAAVGELAADLPVSAEVRVGALPVPLPPPVETTAYFVVAEALTNVVKHARASRVQALLGAEGDALSVEVVDDGIGSPAYDGGSGLPGLRDRLAVLGGTLEVTAAGGGTRVRALIPCG